METYGKALARILERADTERAGAVYRQRGPYEKKADRTTLSILRKKKLLFLMDILYTLYAIV